MDMGVMGVTIGTMGLMLNSPKMGIQQGFEFDL